MTLDTQIKKILENKENKKIEEYNLDLKAIPAEEAKIFLASINQFDKLFLKFDPTFVKATNEDLKKNALIYIMIHDLFHQEINNEDLVKLEILTTAPVFYYLQEITDQKTFETFSLSYFLLGVSSLKINHSSPYCISEKIILGEFFAFGGLDNGIWGLKIKSDLLPQIAKIILDKVEKDSYQFLAKKYQNFKFDFI